MSTTLLKALPWLLLSTATPALAQSAGQPSFNLQPLQPAPPPASPPSAPPAAAKPTAPPGAATKPTAAPGPTAAKPTAKPDGAAATPGPAAIPGGAPKPRLTTGPARPATADRPATRTPQAVTPKAPKPMPAVKLGPPLSKAEVFSRAAPATLILIAVQDNRWSSALGVVVSPSGVVVSDSRLLSGVEKGKINGFMFDPSQSGDEDPLFYMKAHKAEALELQVVRVDPQNHLLMLQLPEPPPKKPYYSLDLAETQGVTVGLDIVALRTRGKQTLAMIAGTIAARRPDMIETEPPLSQDNAGGPLLSQSGRLLAIATYSDKAMHASGQARPVEMVRELLAGKIGAAPVVSNTPSVMEAPAESRNAVEAVRIGFGAALGQRLEKRPALQLHSEFVSAMAARGRAVVREVDSIDTINSIIKGMLKGNDPKSKVVADLFPALITDRKGGVFWKVGISYKPVPGSGGGQAAIDDMTGALYATDSKHSLIYYDAVNTNWRVTALPGIAQMRASGGTLFALMTDGRLIAAEKDGKDTRQLFPRSVKNATLEVSQGVLYMTTDDGSLYRYRSKKWDQKAQPIAFAMSKVVVHGEDWFGMDGAGRVFSSNVQRYIDRDGNIIGLWGVGHDLLVLTRDNNRFYYSQSRDEWGPWTHW